MLVEFRKTDAWHLISGPELTYKQANRERHICISNSCASGCANFTLNFDILN